jgi:hypothetical protein
VESYFLIKLLHVLLFVYWLGGDLGVFHASGYVRDAALSVPQRATALRIMQWLDQVPRYCLVLTLPVAYSLASEVKVMRISAATISLVWILSFLWLANVYAIHRLQGTPRGELLRRIDFVWRAMLVAALVYDAVRGLTGAGNLLTGWVSAKVLIFAVLVLLGLAIRVLSAPLAAALRTLLTQGSTADLEATVARQLGRIRPIVVAIWIGLIAAAYLGIAKPALG